jgi:type II secretory pathway pseudopilin PulG
MFNLIISIIAIALVVVLAGASLYYGGDAFNKGSEEAKASTYINQAQQVQAAATLFKASNGGLPADLAQLVTEKYMAGTPKLATGEGTWVVDKTNSVVYVEQTTGESAKTGMTLAICDTINDNGAGVVSCVETGADLAATIKTGKKIDMDPTPAADTVQAAAKVTVLMKL